LPDRLLGQANITLANLAAVYDARAAVRWLRAHAVEYRIDPVRIGAFGGSAGGMTVEVMAVLPPDDEGDNHDSPLLRSEIAAGVSLSGCLDGPFRGAIHPKQPPLLDFHGCADGVVDYAWGVDSINTIKRAGASADLFSFPGAGHVPFPVLEQPQAWQTLSAFFAEHLELAHVQCPPL
jgi:acetyl esterase/lipase